MSSGACNRKILQLSRVKGRRLTLGRDRSLLARVRLQEETRAKDRSLLGWSGDTLRLAGRRLRFPEEDPIRVQVSSSSRGCRWLLRHLTLEQGETWSRPLEIPSRTAELSSE